MLFVLLLLSFAVRAWRADQPIVENYVGRQIPTAMVARNLARGSGFLAPQLETGPFPNLFLVEPPVYAAVVVGLRSLAGFSLEASGRLMSALGMMLAASGLYGLCRPREGPAVALLAVLALAAFPITLRYGRAFQPDALMFGAVVAGLCCWDRSEAGGRGAWLAAAWALLSAGLALKITSSYVLVPLILVIQRGRRPARIALAASALVPALIWYAYAATRLMSPEGSRAAMDNGAIWIRALAPAAWLRRETVLWVVRYLGGRSFAPIGTALAALGMLGTRGGRRPDRLWWIWGASAAAALAGLAGKFHHEYYWLALAPVVAVGVGRGLVAIGRWQRITAVLAGVAFVVGSIIQAASTWRTPPEWISLIEAARIVRNHVPRGDPSLIAPEALLYEADRRGFRLEVGRASEARAAGEWGERLKAGGRLALVEFYRRRGARLVADVVAEGDSSERRSFHDAIRRRYHTRVDRRGVILAELTGRAGEDADADAD